MVYSRAKAHSPYPEGQPASRYANDPAENQTQYDLYRIPFNEGRGGKPERVVGASENGLSNNFPKVSPDGKWIIWVQNRTGLLMRPDSKLYIVPFQGGTPRPLRSNLPVMNSWHSFSPNGRWLVFSSKWPSLYTELYLTHVDANGDTSPAILIENATASNRAVNIPEFINGPPDVVEKIEAPATEFYRLFNVAASYEEKKQYAQAVEAWNQALQLVPDDSRALNNLGLALARAGRTEEAIVQYRRSLQINAASSQTNNNLGSALASQGHLDEAVACFQKAIELNPANAKAQANLGAAYAEMGRLNEAIEHLQAAVDAEPGSADAQNNLGAALARAGSLEEAIPHFQKAVMLVPDSAGYRFNLGRILSARGRFQKAIEPLEAAVRLTNGQEPEMLDLLAGMYAETGQLERATAVARRALDLANAQGNGALAERLRQNLGRYSSAAAPRHAAGPGGH
jgi:tetratricopeptide (TPR) repeat protein